MSEQTVKADILHLLRNDEDVQAAVLDAVERSLRYGRLSVLLRAAASDALSPRELRATTATSHE